VFNLSDSRLQALFQPLFGDAFNDDEMVIYMAVGVRFTDVESRDAKLSECFGCLFPKSLMFFVGQDGVNVDGDMPRILSVA
jgi:hypothetical protein